MGTIRGCHRKGENGIYLAACISAACSTDADWLISQFEYGWDLSPSTYLNDLFKIDYELYDTLYADNQYAELLDVNIECPDSIPSSNMTPVGSSCYFKCKQGYSFIVNGARQDKYKLTCIKTNTVSRGYAWDIIYDSWGYKFESCHDDYSYGYGGDCSVFAQLKCYPDQHIDSIINTLN